MTATRNRSPLPASPPFERPPSPPPRPAPAALTPAVRRRNPARGAKVVALVSSVATTVGVAGALERAGGASLPATTSVAAAGTTPTTASGTATSNASGLADGVYTGTAEPTKWGPIQVQATIRGGRIVAVEEVLAPSDRKSQTINAQAAPILEQEAIAVQSADLDAVSGATWTSRTYTASLQAALDESRRA